MAPNVSSVITWALELTGVGWVKGYRDGRLVLTLVPSYAVYALENSTQQTCTSNTAQNSIRFGVVWKLLIYFVDECGMSLPKCWVICLVETQFEGVFLFRNRDQPYAGTITLVL